MSVFPTTLAAIVFLATAISWQPLLADDQKVEVASPESVVARWLELHRTGKRAEASALTTGSHFHRADVLLSSKRDTGVRVKQSLGNQRTAAVTTSSLEKYAEGKHVLLFWLVRRDGGWLINKSDATERIIVNERLRGFMEAGDVRWHVRRSDLLGHWESGPCTPPDGIGIACGSQLHLADDNGYRLLAWGPGGPPIQIKIDDDELMQGTWRLADDRIVLSHQNRTLECRVTWMDDNRLELRNVDRKGGAKYDRADAGIWQDSTDEQ